MCDQFEFVALWDCEDDVKTCSQANLKWNEDEHFAHSLMADNSSIAMYHHILFDKDGISPSLFVSNFEWFARDADELVDLLIEGHKK